MPSMPSMPEDLVDQFVTGRMIAPAVKVASMGLKKALLKVLRDREGSFEPALIPRH